MKINFFCVRMEARQDNEFVSFDLPEMSQETINIPSGQLNFLPTNYDLENSKSSDQNASHVSNSLGDLGKLKKCFKKNFKKFASRRASNKTSRQSWRSNG